MKEPLSRFFGIGNVKAIPVDKIQPSPYQPRTIFHDERLDELCQTIRIHGVIQPIIVRKKGKHYELIAGERRWRAVKRLNLSTIPAIVKEMSDRQAASASLIENLQREGLTAIEEAQAYQSLLQIHRLTQESLAQRLGKSQSTIANKLRLLQLPTQIQQALLARKITERHARTMLTLKNEAQQLKLLEEIIEKELNVKQTEDRVKQLMKGGSTKPKVKRKSYSKDFRLAVNTIRQSIDMVEQTGMKVICKEKEQEDCYEWTIRIPK